RQRSRPKPAMAGRSEAQRLDGAESSRRIVDVMVGHTATRRVARSLHRDDDATSQRDANGLDDLDRRHSGSLSALYQVTLDGRRGGKPAACYMNRLRSQRTIQITPQIVNVLDADAEPQQRRRQMFLSRNGGAPLDGGFHRAQTRGVLNQLEARAHRVAGF